MDSSKAFSVSELAANMKNLLEGRFPFVRVAGEISNLSQPASGHLYFTLKDSKAQIRVALFRAQRRFLRVEPKNGMEVLCAGRVTLYEARGDCQLIADTLEPLGAGELARAFNELKERLAREGLFDAALKRPLPALPRHITLVTSPHGAALHDFLRIVHRRFPGIRISVYPVPVQGNEAAGAMVQALQRIRADLVTDVIVLCRGGGSAEDLWAFNDENLARTIREGEIPVVSAVGHEIDFTIADFVADLRAPTPSAAAELLVPEKAALAEKVTIEEMRLRRRMAGILEQASSRVALAEGRLRAMPRPVERMAARVADLRARLERALHRRITGEDAKLADLTHRMGQCDPRRTLARQTERFQEIRGRFLAAALAAQAARERRLERVAAVLQAVGPLATLARGYAIARRPNDHNGQILRRAEDARPGEVVEVLLGAGALDCRVEATRPEGIR